MDSIGLGMLIMGLVLCALGVYAIWLFLLEVILVLKGLTGMAVFLAGIMLVIFGALMFRN